MMNNKNNNKKNNEKPGEPIVIDLASSAEKPNPNAGKTADRRAKRECEAAEAKRKLEVATKNNVIDLDMLNHNNRRRHRNECLFQQTILRE